MWILDTELALIEDVGTLGETKLKAEDWIGKENYEHIRQFDLPNNSTKLIYIYLSSLLNDNILTGSLNFLKNVANLKSMILLSFAHSHQT